MTLLLAADQSTPTDPALMPADVRVVLGYVGAFGNTPHIWTTAEANRVRASGRIWSPIWVTPQRALSARDGADAAAGMLAALPKYGYPRGMPVFLDVEGFSYRANILGARSAIAEWQRGMAAGGYPRAVPYVPTEHGSGWIADWTYARPGSLPAGWLGWQYEPNVGGRGYDLSIFDASLWATPAQPGGPVTHDPLTAADGDLVALQLMHGVIPIDGVNTRIMDALADIHQWTRKAAVGSDATLSALALLSGGTGTVDVAALADALAAVLPGKMLLELAALVTKAAQPPA